MWKLQITCDGDVAMQLLFNETKVSKGQFPWTRVICFFLSDKSIILRVLLKNAE